MKHLAVESLDLSKWELWVMNSQTAASRIRSSLSEPQGDLWTPQQLSLVMSPSPNDTLEFAGVYHRERGRQEQHGVSRDVESRPMQMLVMFVESLCGYGSTL